MNAIRQDSGRGLFVTIEGTEGGGKSTNISRLQDYLESQNISFVCTREPGGTELAEQIRELLLTTRDEAVSENCELLMMFAARAQHISQVIEPNLAKGHWVICDRFTDATYAYQGGGRGVALDKIAELEQLVQGSLRPDITLLFDVSLETGMQRAQSRGELDRFESEQADFFLRVKATYQQLAETHSERYRVIDADQPLEQVWQQVQAAVDAAILARTSGGAGE